VLFTGDDLDFRPVESTQLCLYRVDEALALGGGNTAGTAIGQIAIAVERGEIAARHQVSLADLQTEPEGFQDTAADVGVRTRRVVAEERQMTRAAAGCDSRGHRDGSPESGAPCEGIHVGQFGPVEGGHGLIRGANVANAIQNQQNDSMVVFDRQTGQKIDVIHGRLRVVFSVGVAFEISTGRQATK